MTEVKQSIGVDLDSTHSSSSPKSVAEMHTPEVVMSLEDLDLNNYSAAEKHDEKKNDQENDSFAWSIPCPASQKSLRTQNPIRAIVDPIVKNIQSGQERGDGKDHISLSLGDPTVGGNLPPCQTALDAVVAAALEQPHAAGYINACGLLEARQAIAKFHSHPCKHVTAENVIIASGCSGALELVLTSLLDPGTFILVPQPGFPLYQVIAESHGASILHYRLNPNKNWEIDLDHLKAILSSSSRDHRTIRGILINNPSNPTGAVFSKAHLRSIVSLCNQFRLPIVADEVYGDLTFEPHKFYPMAQIVAECGDQVPVITTSGLAKQYLLPGWRVGWVVFHDNIRGSLQEVEAGAKRLAQVILGSSHLIQTVVPKLLEPTPDIAAWKQTLRRTLQEQATFLYNQLSQCHGLSALAPQGAMYSMVRLDLSKLNVLDDVEFASKLLEEENVFVLPGSAFGCQSAFRVVFCCDEQILTVAAHRIGQFCLRHAVFVPAENGSDAC